MTSRASGTYRFYHRPEQIKRFLRPRAPGSSSRTTTRSAKPWKITITPRKNCCGASTWTPVMSNSSKHKVRKRREDKLDWEELERAPNVEGMYSYLRPVPP